MSAISANLTTPPDNFSTTLSSGINSSALTIPLNSVAGLATEGVGVLFTKDANGDVVAGSVEIIHWTGVGGSSLTLTNTGDRGLTGSDAGAQAYSAGAFFEVWVTSYYYDSLLDGMTPISYLDTDGTLAANSDTKIATQKAVKTYVTASASTIGVDGWIPVSVSWTYASADAPTFTITVPTGAASLYGVGDRIKLTQTTVKYFIITAVADTVLTVYGGTDYTLANAAISAISYSHMKAPLGFPLDPSKWSVLTNDTTNRNQTTPVSGTWYNIGSISHVIPIGAWLTSYQVYVYCDDNSGAVLIDIGTTLSTSSSSESDTEFTATHYTYVNSAVSGSAGTTLHRQKALSIASKTTYYLLELVRQTAPSSSLNIQNSAVKLAIRSVCAYL